jgi:hypothetical protein
LQAVGWKLMNTYLLPWLAVAVIAISWLGYTRTTASRRIA